MGTEERICCVTSIGILVFVLSAVSLIYMTKLIYLPAHRELTASINPNAVTCKTVYANDTAEEDCASFTTCFEWCLSKSGNTCMQIYVYVRENGVNATFQGCNDVVIEECTSYTPDQAMDRNCTEHPACAYLNGYQNCTKGVCKNITEFYTCATGDGGEASGPRNCMNRDRCNHLDGIYACSKGACYKKRVEKRDCERKCKKVSVDSKNVILFTTSGYFAAHCATADNETRANWTSKDFLMATCEKYEQMEDGSVHAVNCIDGVALDPAIVRQQSMNYTELLAFHKNHTYSNIGAQVMPYEDSVILINRTKLQVNLEQCVNSLEDECNTIYRQFGIDGSESRNFSPAAVFPCYYDAGNIHNYVLLKYSREATFLNAVITAAVPSGLLCFTCIGLFLCSKIVRVDGSRMFIQLCPDDDDTGDEQFDEL